jgi:hypothetical protein
MRDGFFHNAFLHILSVSLRVLVFEILEDPLKNHTMSRLEAGKFRDFSLLETSHSKTSLAQSFYIFLHQGGGGGGGGGGGMGGIIASITSILFLVLDRSNAITPAMMTQMPAISNGVGYELYCGCVTECP